MARDILWIGLLMGLVSLGMGWWAYNRQMAAWQTMVFTTLTLAQMGNALATRSDNDTLVEIGIFSNPSLLGSVLLTLVLQLAVIYVPFLQGIFETVSLTPAELAISLLFSLIVLAAVETVKWLRKRMAK
jgi:Ca2+-transporting ATPase